jgi:hypothetical protein
MGKVHAAESFEIIIGNDFARRIFAVRRKGFLR